MGTVTLDSAGVSTKTVQVIFEGVSRTVLVSEPARWSADAVPLILDLHASGMDAVSHQRTTRLEEHCRAVVVRPQGIIPLQFRPGLPWGWAWGIPGVNLYGRDDGDSPSTHNLPEDTSFLSSILNGKHRLWRSVIDGTHLSGFSGGARMACHLATETPVDSIAVVAGLRPPDRGVARAIDVLAIHGRHDTVNPFDGGNEARWNSPVVENAEAWRGQDGGRTSRVIALPNGANAQMHQFGRATLIEHLGGGHSWPGATDPAYSAAFEVGNDISASALIAQFIESGTSNVPPRRA
jgi:poly(3-hydroxybutyrate) depolymerase